MIDDDEIICSEYHAIRNGAAIYNAQDRGLIQVTGKDRAAWLHNLVTNVVKTLTPGQGNYAFALNVKGRILFDLNMLALPDALWLDIDRRLVPKALAHLDRYIISEDVQLKDRSEEYTRIILLGPKASAIADALGATQIDTQPQLSSVSATLVQKNRLLVRHDLGRVFGAELYVESADSESCWKRLLEIGAPVELRAIGINTFEAVRIESGIPASAADIDEECVPAETQQLARAVNFTKGCYLGQEVVERMRSHNVLPRKLVSLDLSGPATPPTPIRVGDTEIGRLTSACQSPAIGRWIGLGYVKTQSASLGTSLNLLVQPAVTATVRTPPG